MLGPFTDAVVESYFLTGSKYTAVNRFRQGFVRFSDQGPQESRCDDQFGMSEPSSRMLC
jgi:hypothetical protein